MGNRDGLQRVTVTRTDGIVTNVWKRIDDAFKKRVDGISSAPKVSTAPEAHVRPFEAADAFDANNVAPHEKPSWWKKYEQDCIPKDKGAQAWATKPELLDIIDSPIGELAVTWQPISQMANDESARDSGYEVSVLTLMNVETGEIEGYVKTSFMTDAAFERSFGTDEFARFRFRNRYGHSYNGLEFQGYDHWDDWDGSTPSVDVIKRQVWNDAHHDFELGFTREDGKYVAPYNLSINDAPEGERLDKDLEELTKLADESVQHSRDMFDTPFIDYSRVKNVELTGQGFGSAMYLYAAKRLGRDGNMLRASGIQTAEAQAVWKRFTENYPDNITEITRSWHGNAKTYKTLDFRN